LMLGRLKKQNTRLSDAPKNPGASEEQLRRARLSAVKGASESGQAVTADQHIASQPCGLCIIR
jgi:hypothetical protein